MAPAEGQIWETRLALEWRVGFRQLRTCRQIYADFRSDRTSSAVGVGAAFEAPADKVRFGRAASDGPAGCGAWPPARWRGWPGVLWHAARGALYGFGCGLPLTSRPGRLPVALPVSPVARGAQGSWRGGDLRWSVIVGNSIPPAVLS